jgi:hypothetical protein
MMSPATGPRLLTVVTLLWAGLALGVGFVATPAKFLAPSLTLSVALDVGRHTFAIFNHLEIAILAATAALALFDAARWSWFALLAVPGAVVLAQALWLIPALDVRVSEILAGGAPPPSWLHGVYIGAEALKVAGLVLAALLGPRLAARRGLNGRYLAT